MYIHSTAAPSKYSLLMNVPPTKARQICSYFHIERKFSVEGCKKYILVAALHFNVLFSKGFVKEDNILIGVCPHTRFLGCLN